MVGIVILNYNTYEATIQCVESITKNVKSAHHIYVVDNNSNKSCVNKLTKYLEGNKSVTLLLLKQNLGYSGGNNEGIKRALLDGVSSILILNSDVILLNDIVSIMEKRLTGEIAVIGPKVSTPQNTNGQSLRKNYKFVHALTDKKPFNYLRRINNNWDTCIDNPDWDKEVVFYGMVSGCCFLIDAKVFDSIGLFDDNVFLYTEEYILGKKLEELGLKTLYAPDASIIHNHGTSTNLKKNGFVDYHRYASAYYLLKRYCKVNPIQLFIIKQLSLTNFAIKTIMDPSFRKRMHMLRVKLNEIDEGKYKITY